MEEEKKVIQPEGSGVEPATIARTVCLFIALVNQLLAVCGKGTIGIAGLASPEASGSKCNYDMVKQS